MAEPALARAVIGIAVEVLWKSALIPTTRPWHASLKRSVYVSDEVRQLQQRDPTPLPLQLRRDTGRRGRTPILSDKLKAAGRRRVSSGHGFIVGKVRPTAFTDGLLAPIQIRPCDRTSTWGWKPVSRSPTVEKCRDALGLDGHRCRDGGQTESFGCDEQVDAGSVCEDPERPEHSG